MDNKQRKDQPGPRHGQMQRFEKPKNFKASSKRFLQYLKPYSFGIIVSLALASVGALFNITGPKLLGDITTQIQINITKQEAIDLGKIGEIGMFLITLYILSFIFQIIQSFIMTRVTQNITQKLRSNISIKINKVPLRYFDNQSYGDVLSRVTNDVDTIAMMLNQTVVQFIMSLTFVIAIFVFMLTISPILTLITVLSFPISIISMIIIMKHSQKFFSSQQKSLGNLNGHIEEVYSGHNVIRVFNGEKKVRKEFTAINQELYQSAWKSQFYSGLMRPILMFVGNLSYVATSIVGSILAINNGLTIGAIQSFIIYIRRINQPIMNLSQVFTSLQSTIAASERVFEFLDEEEVSDESSKVKVLDLIEGNVEFKHVRFGYTPDKMVIKDFNLKATKGQKIAIVGPTGAGKTTLVNLLMRFYEINDGEILVDGVSLHDITRENTHALFGMVLQDTWLFQGTIYENLTYGRKDISLEQVKEACKIANVDHFIEALPGGYDMVLDEESSISQGQKQLLTIARTIVENAPMLILDEATSSVDTRTENLIQNAMDNLMKGRTSFVIAHRLSTIKNADVILVMNEGDIIETGTHEELLAKNGFYANLYNAQFEKLSNI